MTRKMLRWKKVQGMKMKIEIDVPKPKKMVNKRNPCKDDTVQTMLEKTQATLDDDQIEKFYCIYFDSSQIIGGN